MPYQAQAIGDAFPAESGLELNLNQMDLDAGQLPMFVVERVQMQFSIAADFVAAQVANNVLVLALSNGRILRIDLNKPEDIDDIDLPRKASEIGVIRCMFLDPTASHLLICTSLGENYYLHSQTKIPRPLSRLRGVAIESIAWNPSLPTASTREILIGAADGNIYEVFIETSNEFYKKEVKNLKLLHKLSDGPITGLYVDSIESDVRRILISTQTRLIHLVGKIGLTHESAGSIYTRLFEAEEPTIHQLQDSTSQPSSSALTVSPDPPNTSNYDDEPHERVFAWLSSQGIFHGKLLRSPISQDLGSYVYSASKLLSRSQLVNAAGKRSSHDTIDAVALTQWHVVTLVGTKVIITNQLTGEIVYNQAVLDVGDAVIGFSVDVQKNTFWLFTASEIFEIVIRDEDRNVWQIMMKTQQYPAALKYARTPIQKETVATAYGDFLMKKGQYNEAADIYGRSNKPFEEVALGFIDAAQPDALRKYLLAKLLLSKKSAVMQRIMMASWLVEIFMGRLNSLEDDILTQTEPSEVTDPSESQELMKTVRKEYESFVMRYKDILDRKTVYEIIGSHGRESELLFFAESVNDYGYVLAYWVQRESWNKGLGVLKKQTDPEVFYKYSSVLLTHAATEMVEILMRHPDLKTRRLIPAMLEYNRNFKGSPAQNQAVRYLLYVVNQLDSKDAAVHNTLVSLYASNPAKDESALLAYLESQGDEPSFDSDFALRLCIEHHRTLSCVHIYTNMGQYLQAVDLALSHGEIELASVIADRPLANPALRKKLWLAVARKVISQSNGNGIKAAIDFLKRCDLLKIEDLIPFFPDFVVIDDFKEEICTALEDYSRSIDALKAEMDEAAQTAANIKSDIAALDQRYAIVEPGEKCYACSLPLLSRQFFVFPCQHAFHSDCLGRRVLEMSGMAISSRIKELQVQVTKGLVSGSRREAMVAELDGLVASACVLCSDLAIRRIDEPFVGPDEDQSIWVL
ncbi:Vacuolar membrane protein pep3 [Ceratocystis fimbriata CBS 114723]|uniref:Vacuolar membrane protein pep3 n=1 Tax=Ceratocystis fimbriata CBS 114723 TaxID=1035309 RepID=A0A2C5XHW2_9PEZI|nr:Vacuolar membrane protein pep3 [Ceratocystis fimbriata CBS 114723]